MALVKAQDARDPGLHDSRGWWLHFKKAVMGAGFESWCQSYYINHRELINSGKLSARKLARDFSELFLEDTDVTPGRTIAQGSFTARKKPANRKRSSGTATETDEEGCSRQTVVPNKQKRGDDACELCELSSHTLESCYYAIPSFLPSATFEYRTRVC